MKNELFKRAIAIILCFLTLLMGMPLPLSAQISTYETRKDTAADFNNFISSCTLEERILLMQALGGLDDEDLEDSYFGSLKGLASLNSYAIRTPSPAGLRRQSKAIWKHSIFSENAITTVLQ